MLPPAGDPWEMTLPNTANTMDWRERERRQRSVRLLMMFLLMLLLMDGEEQSSRARRPSKLRKRRTKPLAPLEEALFQRRQMQDERLARVARTHPRYRALVSQNENVNYHVQVQHWAKDKSLQKKVDQDKDDSDEEEKEEAMKKVYHYPWNATGFYRGEWERETAEEDEDDDAIPKTQKEATATDHDKGDAKVKTPKELEHVMEEVVEAHHESMGVFLLPSHTEVRLGRNFTLLKTERAAAKVAREALRAQMSHVPKSPWVRVSHPELNVLVEKAEDETPAAEISLTKRSGRAAFQFYSRSIPGMQEMSLVDGFVKMYDSNTVGYSTRRDILLRVRGVVLHAIGRISLVSNVDPGRSALVVSDKIAFDKTEKPPLLLEGDKQHQRRRRRRLEQVLSRLESSSDKEEIDKLRDDVLSLYPPDSEKNLGPPVKMTSLKMDESGFIAVEEQEEEEPSSETNEESENDKEETVGETTVEEEKITARLAMVSDDKLLPGEGASALKSDKTSKPPSTAVKTKPSTMTPKGVALVDKDLAKKSLQSNATTTTETVVEASRARSKIVIPYPFVADDKQESVRKAKTPATRRMPPREQALEANAGQCEFEINLDIQEVEWTLGEWRKLVSRHVQEAFQLNPLLHKKDVDEDDKDDEEDPKTLHMKRKHASATSSSLSARSRQKAVEDEALVMMLSGSIVSPNCDFISSLNATAIRTDWEHTTGKAINYSFYMMLTCLAQIVVLLRQLLHSQSQSAATRVSLLSIGWQTVLDALVCLGHIYLSLAMQPLFTAFASVAFFKLLIFCVIEMKYMAIIIQARNNANGGQSTAELLRRQLAMLHLRFYLSLMAAFIAFFYAWERYRIVYVLALYSFWVPQIVQNVITEAKRPLHHYYIYGMSLTRLVVPLYMFALRDNFLKEVYPDSPTDGLMCQCLVAWVGFQAAVLIAQTKYGARFMIPQRFLPPKFDYSRPIPASLLPEGVEETPPLVEELVRSPRTKERQSLLDDCPASPDPHSITGTRNRIKRGSSRVESPAMTTEELVHDPSDTHTLDCVICYNGIDIHNRHGYMLAPCDHIFHRECLVQWMDVKMECPICRTELPSL